ncbi:MAG: M20/M25/M40 family metallo-hydrolase, partial [Myxococcota bacterium]
MSVSRRTRGAIARRLLVLFLAGVTILAGIVVGRTLLFTAESTPLPSPGDLQIDQKAAAAHLAGALRFETVTRSTKPRLNPEAFEGLHEYLRETFPLAHTRLSTETVAQHSLLFKWEGQDPSAKPILMLAHQDVVPVEPEALDAWTHPPFSGTIADGFIWGRGALDDKQGVVGILHAVEILLESGFQPRRTVYLAFDHDEEIGGSGAQATVALLKKRGVQLAFVVDEGGVLTQGVVPDVSDWVALIGVAEKGYVSLKLTTRGTGGHSSMPPPQTAVGVLAKAVAKLEAQPFPARTEASQLFFERVGPKMPFGPRMVFANMWLFEPLVVNLLSKKGSTNATLRTTTAATIFRGGVKDNLLPKRAEAVVNFRIIPGETPETVKSRVESVIDDDRVIVGYLAEEGGSSLARPTRVSSTDGQRWRVHRRPRQPLQAL